GAIVLNDVWSSSDGVNWTRVIANAPWPARSKHTSVAFNNRIWVIGGWNGGAVIKDVWSSFDGASWTQDPAVVPWDARARHTSVVHNNRIWVIGGYTGSSYFNDVWSASSPPTLPPGALCGMAGTCGPVSGGGSCTRSDFDNFANCASGLGDPSTANPCGGCGCGTDCCTVPPGCD